VPSDWVRLSAQIAPAAEQVLWLSAKAFGETLHFHSIEKIQNGKYINILLHLASELEVTILGMIATPVLQCNDLIVCNIFSNRFV